MKKIVLNRVIVWETIYFKMKIDEKKFAKICKFEKLQKNFFANLKKIYYKTGSLTLKISCKKFQCVKMCQFRNIWVQKFFFSKKTILLFLIEKIY